MKLALITDQHFGARSDSQYFLDNIDRFYKEIFFPTLIEQGIKTVCMLGDTWENRRSLNIKTMNWAFENYFDRLEELGIQVNIIYGNHDVFYRNSNKVNSIDFLGKMYPNIHVIKTHEVIDFDGLPIAFLSWVNKNNLKESLEFIETAKAPILCGHFEIKTFEMHPGFRAETGLDKSIFHRFEKVYSGHFHTMSTDGRVQYISNTNQSTWADYNQLKGFRILDTDTRELTLVENPFKVYGKIAYTDDISLMDFDYEQFDNQLVRVYVQSFGVCNRKKLSLFIERLNQSAKGVDVFEVDETDYKTEQMEAAESTDMQNLITQYIDEVVDNELIDKPKLRSKFNNLYKEAIEETDV